MADKQHMFVMTSQKIDHRGSDAATPCMELVPPNMSPGPWELVSWKFDTMTAGRIVVVWRHG